MLSKNDIIRILNEHKHYIDEFILDAFIKNWKIEAIYEDENGIEYYDEAALEKVRNALCNKSELQQEACSIEIMEEEIAHQEEQVEEASTCEIEEGQSLEPVCIETPDAYQPFEEPKEETKVEVVEAITQPIEVPAAVEPELKNVTLNITNQTLNVLAQSIAEKITGDISGYLKKTDILEEALNAGSFKRDNEILSIKLKEVLDDNKVLIKRIQELEKEKDSYLKVVANIYVKKP